MTRPIPGVVGITPSPEYVAEPGFQHVPIGSLPSIPDLVSGKAWPLCEFCDGTGWVCEDDPTIPAHTEHCCGVGSPCGCTGLE